MVKKLQKMADKKAASANTLLDNQLANAVKDSAQQIWLAGMGAFSKAQEEGGKMFQNLIAEGVSLQKKTQAVATEKFSDVSGKMTAMAGDVTAKAGRQWDKLETIFEERVAKALNKLGVPTAKEVETLIQRIDELSAAVAKLSKASAAKTARVAKPAANGAAKPAAKRASSRKAAASAGE